MNGICSICGLGKENGSITSTGPSPHEFHGHCLNAAENLRALHYEINGRTEEPPKKMAFWPSADKA